MKRFFLTLLCTMLLLTCGCDREAETPNTMFDGTYPGDFQPVLRVNDCLYSWAGYSYDYVVAEDSDSVSVVAGETVLPQGYTEYKEIIAVTEDAPAELELRADFNATGTIYTDPEQLEAVYVLLKSSVLQKDRYVRFVTPVLETPTLSYKGSLYAIGDFEDLKNELPEGYDPIGSLTYIGKDLIPEEDFETNCFTDCYSKTLDGRQVYGSEENTRPLYLAQTKYSALGDSQCFIPCTYLGPTDDIPRLESVTEESAAFFFRNCDEFTAEYNNSFFHTIIFEEERSFFGLRQELEAAGAIPVLEGYEHFSSTVDYMADGSIVIMSLAWMTENSSNALHMNIKTAIQSESGPMYTIDHEKATKTRVGELTVYATATEWGEHLIEVTLTDGSICQIQGYGAETEEEMLLLLSHLIEQGVPYDAMAMEQGDHYTPIDPETVRAQFASCLPDPSGLPLALDLETALAKNSTPITYTQQYFYDEAGDIVEYNATLSTPKPELSDLYLGNIRDITEEDILSTLDEYHRVSFALGDYTIMIYGYSVPAWVVMELIRSVPDYPHKEELPDAGQFFRENTGQEGGDVVACGLIGPGYTELDFSERIGQLMNENALPVIRGEDTPKVTVSFVDEEITGIRVNWPQGLRLKILAPGLVSDESYYVPEEKCTKTEIDGVTVYGDGTMESEQKALLFTLPEGSSCEIVAEQAVSGEDMVRVLQFLLKNGVKYDAFDYDLGEVYEQVPLADIPEFLGDFVPTELDDLTCNEVWLRSRGDIPIYAGLVYYNEAGLALEWEIFYSDLYMKASYQQEQIGSAAHITEKECIRELDAVGDTGGFHNGSSIYLYVTVHQNGLGSTVYDLLQTIKLI